MGNTRAPRPRKIPNIELVISYQFEKSTAYSLIKATMLIVRYSSSPYLK